MALNRATIRVIDKKVHHDFPGKYVGDRNGQKLYHRIQDTYPIKAVRYEGRNGVILYPSGRKSDCTVVETIKWKDKWHIHMYCMERKNENILVINGARTDMLDFTGDSAILEICDPDSTIEFLKKDGKWKINGLNCESASFYDKIPSNTGVSKTYNKKSDLFHIAFNNSPRSITLLNDG